MEHYFVIVNCKIYWNNVSLQVAVDFCNHKTLQAIEKNEHCVAQVIDYKTNKIVYLSVTS